MMENDFFELKIHPVAFQIGNLNPFYAVRWLPNIVLQHDFGGAGIPVFSFLGGTVYRRSLDTGIPVLTVYRPALGTTSLNYRLMEENNSTIPFLKKEPREGFEPPTSRRQAVRRSS